MPKNVTAMRTGMTSISCTVLRGLRPAVVSAAYDREPKSPEPPVPDDQVETTFLQMKTYMNQSSG